MLEEVAAGDHPLELGGRNEVVVLGVALARAGLARGKRNGQTDVRIARQAGVDDAGFPRARWCRNDVEGSAHLLGGQGPGTGDREKQRVRRALGLSPRPLSLVPSPWPIQCSAPVRGSGRSAPSIPPRHWWCAGRPIWSPGYWTRG